MAPKVVKVHAHCVKCGGSVLETCRQCGHTTFCDVCGSCNIHGEPKVKKEPTREFHCSVEFIPKKGSYSFKGEKVVKAFSLNGALRKGVYELKKQLVPKGRQLAGIKSLVIPMTKRKG
jgi:hypothetical protein